MKKRRIFPGVVALIVMALFVGTLWFLWTKSRPTPVVHETERPLVADIVKKVIVSGTIEPRREIEIKPRIAGILRRLVVEAGQKVKKGDLIGEVQVIPDVVSLNEAELRYKSSIVSVDHAKRELDRAEVLAKRGAAALTELDKLRSDYAVAVEELHAADSRVRLVRDGAAGKDSAAVSSTRIESTVDGTVLQVPVKVGSSVINANTFSAGTTVAVVADMADLIFRGRVDESEVGKLRGGMPIEVLVGALEEARFDGRLERIAPKSQVRDGVTEFEVEAAFHPPSDVVMRAGYSANADIVIDRRDKVLAVTERMVVFDHDRRFVEVQVGPLVFERREVRLGISDGLRVEVLSGLNKEDVIQRPQRAAELGAKF